MNYEDTKNALMTVYPRLYVDEIDVLHDLFFVLGTGYHWLDGELTCERTVEEMIEEKEAYNIDGINPNYEPKDATLEQLRKMEVESRLQFIEAGITDSYFLLSDGKIGRTMYRICEYTKILHVPADVKPDWLDAARKAIDLTKTDIFRTTENDREWIKKAEDRLKEMGLWR